MSFALLNERAFSLRALTRVNAYCIFMSQPISVLGIWIGHFDWLAHEYAIHAISGGDFF